jgi:hypothetical protein
MTSRQSKIFVGVTVGALVVPSAVFALLRVAPGAHEAVDVVSTALMLAGGVVLLVALLVLARNRRT